MKKFSDRKMDIGILILLSFISSIIIYSKFIFGEYIYAYTDMGYDTVHSYLPQFEYLAQVIREGNFSLYSFQIGMGTDTSDYYAHFTNPFAWIPILYGAFAGVEQTGYAIVYMQIVIGIVAGIVMYCYLQRFRFHKVAILLVSYIYSLNGYLFSTGQHYVFAHLTVWVPLLYLCIEVYLCDRKKWYWLLLISTYVGVRGGTTAFALMFAGGVYVVLRYLMQEKRTFLQKMQGIVRCAWWMILGLGCSMIIFLPRMHLIMNTNRIAQTSSKVGILEYIRLLDWEQFRTAILRLFSNNLSGTVSNWNGADYHFTAYPYYLSVVFIFCLTQWIYFNVKEKRKWNLIVGGVITFAIIDNFFPYLMNMFAYSQYRQMELLLPIFMIMMADVLTNFIEYRCYHRGVMYITLLVSIIVVVCLRDNVDSVGEWITVGNVVVSGCVFVGIMELLYHFINGRNKTLLCVMELLLFFAVGCNLIVDHRESVYADRTPMLKTTLVSTFHSDVVKKAIEIANELERDNVFRMSKNYLGETAHANWSLTLPVRTVDAYYSCLNGTLKEYGKNFSFADPKYVNGNQMIYSTYNYGTSFDSYMATMLGIRYLISSYPRECADWSLISQLDEYRYLYKNKMAKTIGLLYDNHITEDDYEQLSELDRAYVTEQTVVLKESNSHMNFGIAYNELKNLIKMDDIFSTGNDLQIISDRICGESVDYTEIHIPIENSNLNQSGQQNVVQFDIQMTDSSSVDVVFNNGYAQDYFNSWNTQLEIQGQEKRTITRTIPQDAQEIVILIQGTTNFAISIPSIYSSTNCGFTNEGITIQNENMGDVVNCQVECEDDKVLFLSIPYSKGWKATLNQKEVEIYKANYGFMAIKLPAGRHVIELTYRNPYMNIGMVISLFSLCVSGIIFCYNKKVLK